MELFTINIEESPHSPKMIEISYFAKDGKHNGILKTINKVSKN